MAPMSLGEFERYVISICSASPTVKNVAIIKSGLVWLNIRAYLTDGSFVDVFYNQLTSRTTYAQIWEERRIFGADNKKGWHWHPREDPASHVAAKSEISFEEFMAKVEADIK
ncbi:MAG: hypothetical protein HZB19_12065 [Chloroflexi bacterium]|nr:hypothetical protein [Chloroflexota bacterium]